MKRLVLASIISSVLIGCSCQKKNISDLEKAPIIASKEMSEYKIIYQTMQSPYKEKRYEVVANGNDFNKFISQLNLEEKLVVNFSKATVVILNMAEKNTGGYNVEPISLEEVGETLVLKVKENSPKPHDRVTMAFTSPLTVLEVNSKKKITISVVE